MNIIPSAKNDYTLVCENNNFLLDHFDNCIKIYEDETSPAKKIWMDNVKSIENGKFIIVGVDPYYLPYDPVYHKFHAFHTLIFCGYDKTSREVYIIDVGERVQYKGKIALQDFLLARNSENPKSESHISGAPINNVYFEVNAIDNASVHYKLSIIQTLERLYDYFNSLEDATKKTHGPRGLLEFANKLSFTNNTLDMEIINKLYTELYGITCRKRLISLYLKIMKDGFGFDTSKTNEKMTEIISKWEITYNLLIKIKILQNDDLYRKFLSCFKDSIQYEIKMKDGIQDSLYRIKE